jgi:16S rRNA (cytosine967-C5)-methyltransferase
MKHVAVGGRLIYATCSLEREEDEAVIDDAIQTNQSFRVIPMSDVVQPLRDTGELVLGDTNSLINGAFLRTIPGIHKCDGFFVSTLERVS